MRRGLARPTALAVVAIALAAGAAGAQPSSGPRIPGGRLQRVAGDTITCASPGLPALLEVRNPTASVVHVRVFTRDGRPALLDGLAATDLAELGPRQTRYLELAPDARLVGVSATTEGLRDLRPEARRGAAAGAATRRGAAAVDVAPQRRCGLPPDA